jgi:hypothetical protein
MDPDDGAGMLGRMIERVLFLDFDGVLHPVGGPPGHSLPFEHMHALEAVLRRWPALQVVIASSWREHYELEQLRDFFADDLRDRVVGVTPVLEREGEFAVGRRQKECLAWLAANAPEARWLALDDDATLYESGPHALICDAVQGLSDPATIERLECWLCE